LRRIVLLRGESFYIAVFFGIHYESAEFKGFLGEPGCPSGISNVSRDFEAG
jgi:hypothetical protein